MGNTIGGKPDCEWKYYSSNGQLIEIKNYLNGIEQE